MQKRLGHGFGRFFLVLFVWLQCLAPLLHAHAGDTHHFGLHLPEDTRSWMADIHASASPGHHVGNMHAVGVSQGHRVDPALQAIADPPVALAPLRLSFSSVQPILAALVPPPSLPPAISRLLPLPGAPPAR